MVHQTLSAEPTVDRATMLQFAFAHAAASVGRAQQASAEHASLLTLANASPQDASFSTQRDAAARLANFWTVAARDLAILEAVRGLSDPETYSKNGVPAAPWYGLRRDLDPSLNSPEIDLAPTQIDGDPE
jgi:hypothetical protein